MSRAQILKQIDASLKRLRVDYVDLYQCHRYDTATPIDETMEALSDVVRQGKARYIGFSEWTARQIEGAFAVAGAERFVSSQPQYSLLWRQPEEESFLYARRRTSRKSSGHRSRKACCPANICRTRSLQLRHVRPATRWVSLSNRGCGPVFLMRFKRSSR